MAKNGSKMRPLNTTEHRKSTNLDYNRKTIFAQQLRAASKVSERIALLTKLTIDEQIVEVLRVGRQLEVVAVERNLEGALRRAV